MLNHYKKLMAFAMLLIAASVNAQTPAGSPVQNKPMAVRPMMPHSVEWYRASMQKRYPNLKASPVTQQRTLTANRLMPDNLNPALIRQRILARYPQARQTTHVPQRQPLAATNSLLPGGRTMAFYRDHAMKQVERAQQRANALHKQPIPASRQPFRTQQHVPTQQPATSVQQPIAPVQRPMIDSQQPAQVQQPAAIQPLQPGVPSQRRTPLTRGHINP